MSKLLTRLQKRRSAYAAIAMLLILGRLLLARSGWQGSVNSHVLMESVAATLALFVGVLALVRFYTKQKSTYFFIGIGFVGAGLLDTFHAWQILSFNNLLSPTAVLPQIWQWNASPIFLSILLAGSWIIWRRNKQLARTTRRQYVMIALVAFASLIIFALIPTPPLDDTAFLSGRVTAVFTTVFFLVALFGYLHKRAWHDDTFEHWVVIALIINVAAQGLFMSFTRVPFDALFDAALLLKQVGYLCVLVGLLSSIYAIFKESEQVATSQLIANEMLQREIAERKRAEAAEQEQRNLAEALRQVGLALNATLDFDSLLDKLLDQIGPVLRYDTANIMLVHKNEIEIAVTRGYDPSKALRQPRHFDVHSRPSLLRMIETAEPLIIPDTYLAGDLWVDAELSPHVRSWAGAPIIVEGEVVAFLALNDSEPGFYQPENATRLKDFAIQAAIAFENADLYQQLQKRVAELTTLNRISQAITSTLDLTETLTIITENTTQLLQVDAASVVLHDKEADDLWFAAASGEASEFVQGKRLALGQGILGWVSLHGEPLLVPDTAADSRYFGDFDAKSGFQARSILCVPLKVKGQPIGAIEAINKLNGTFDEEDLRLLTRLAVPAATAIENAQLFAQSQQEVMERKRAESALEAERTLLARRVEERTADLRTANAELARAARMKDEFLASVSHELRTPLNAILGISEALQEAVYGEMNERQIGSLHSIEESGRHLLSLINDILDLSKVEAGKLELELAAMPVEAVCQASLRMIKQDAHQKQLRIHTAFDSKVTIFTADERRVKQVLVNLLSNAVKFTPPGGDIGIEVVGDKEANAVLITVWDTGIGIAGEHLQQLFQPFVQLDSRLSREYAGTGLGLSLVLRMMELHGGSVAVKSQVGEGSRFTVSFPWLVADVMKSFSDHDLPEIILKREAHSSQNRDSAQPLILLAEDHEANINTFSTYLIARGFDLILARNGLEAVARATADKPDLILMDIQMPQMNGLDAIQKIREDKDTAVASIPIIAVTALAMPGDEQACLEAGANGYLSKPVSLRKLVETIKGHLTLENQAEVTIA